MSNHNRHGDVFAWPEDHEFGRFEREWDRLMIEIRKPLLYMLDCFSALFDRVFSR